MKIVTKVTMEQLKTILSALLRNSLDRVSIIQNLKKLKQVFDDDAPFVILKYKLQLYAVESICREETQNVYYQTLKKESQSYLEFHSEKLYKTKFSCCLAGCLYTTERHRSYIRHIKHSHSRESRLVCQFGLKCTSTFASLDLLMKHLGHQHYVARSSRAEVVPAEIPCKCTRMKCLGAEFSNIQSLMLHLRNKHPGEVIDCIFEGCMKSFDNRNSLKSHFSLKHTKLNLCSLKSVNKVQVAESSSSLNLPLIDNNEEDCEPIVEDDYSDEESPEENYNEDNLGDDFMMAYCDFLNRLANFYFVPHSTIQIIGDEYLKNYNKSNEAKMADLKKSLQKIPGISDAEIERVIGDCGKQDEFFEAQTQLNTEYKRTQYIKNKFTFVSPEEIVLNPNEVKEENAPKAVLHYIPIIETFKNLVEDKTFNSMMEKNVNTGSDSCLNDLKDGELYRSNPFFIENPGAYTMLLYSDAIELVNPLGAGRGKHKVIQIFFTLAEIPKHERSKIDNIQLVAVFKEKLIKQFGFRKIYERLVKDLHLLESGAAVSYPVQRTVQCGVLIHPADNLEDRHIQ